MMTEKERLEMLNIRNRVVSQREEIKRLQEQVKQLKAKLAEVNR